MGGVEGALLARLAPPPPALKIQLLGALMVLFAGDAVARWQLIVVERESLEAIVARKPFLVWP